MYKTSSNSIEDGLNLFTDGNANLLVEPDQIAAKWRKYFAAQPELLTDIVSALHKKDDGEFLG
jgi:hypothetical protein